MRRVFEVVSTMTARGAGIGLAKLKVQDYAFQMTIRRDLKIADLLRTVADFLIVSGRCGNIQLDASLVSGQQQFAEGKKTKSGEKYA
jgi:hypothetical protein